MPWTPPKPSGRPKVLAYRIMHLGMRIEVVNGDEVRVVEDLGWQVAWGQYPKDRVSFATHAEAVAFVRERMGTTKRKRGKR